MSRNTIKTESKRLDLSFVDKMIPASKNGMQHVYCGEKGYMQLLRDVFEYGSEIDDRTGVGRQRTFSQTLRFDLRDSFPLFTVRNTPPEKSIHEFWAFLNSVVHIHPYLEKKGVPFWKGNTTREFLDNRGLHHLPEGHFGKSYGFQLAHFGGELDENFEPKGGINQLQNVFETLAKSPFDSRMISSMWNPSQLDEMALPPCWYANQFLTTLDNRGNKVLNLSVTARSADLIFGTPYNVCQYGCYLYSVSKAQKMIPGELSCHLVDAHIYGKKADLHLPESEVHSSSQMRYAVETLSRKHSHEKVGININKELNSLKDVLALNADDFEFTNYHPNLDKYETKRPTMAV
tara:strand:+ start:735 stop:1775 length:1041 start_codon:yes stop_codon:yes gene_type:complete